MVGAEVSKIPTITPPLMLGAEVSFHEGPKCLNEGPKCFFFKKKAEVSNRGEVVGAEVSKPPTIIPRRSPLLIMGRVNETATPLFPHVINVYNE